MRIVITGAGGFLGRALVARLRQLRRQDALVLIDMHFPPGMDTAPGVTCITGSIADPGLLSAALQPAPDCVFHLASVPGGRAERSYELGRTVNLEATLHLLDILARTRGDRPPIVVFASSVAVYGGNLPAVMREDHPPAPMLSYGAQKWMGEILLGDLSRRGWVDGRALRLSGIVTRPPDPPGQGVGAISIFLSDLLRDLPRGIPVTVPMSPGATTWLASLACCVDNLLHAAAMPTPKTGIVFTPPPVQARIADLVAGISRHQGRDLSSLVTYAPVPQVEAGFGAHPPLICAGSQAAGFVSDGTLERLIARAS